MYRYIIPIAMAGIIIFASCTSNSVSTPASPSNTEAITVSEIPADTGKTGSKTYFSLAENKITDSSMQNTTKWDIALASTRIYVNGGSSGPGQGAALILKNVDFDAVKEAPANGYRVDSEGSLAIMTGSDNGWYHYDPDKHTISPIPGVVIIVRTADGKYAKLQILSYYKGWPDNIPDDVTKRVDRLYTFRYVLQKNGSRNF